MGRASFSIEVDADLNLLRITMSGFFEAEDIARYLEARTVAFTRLRCKPNQHLTLVDLREMQIQSQESLARFQQDLSEPTTAAKRVAFVVAKSLARLQIKRAAAGQWLFSEG